MYIVLNNIRGSILLPRTPCNIAPVVGAALIGGAAKIGSSLLGIGSTNSTNRSNLRIMREQNKFNAQEAEKQRKWQEDYYNKFSSPSALAAQYRAAGLNALLQGVQPGSVASGAQASAAESAVMQSPDYSGIGDAISGSVNQMSSLSVNQSVVDLNHASKALKEAEAIATRQGTEESKARVDNMRQSFKLMQATFDDSVKGVYLDNMVKKWQTFDIEQDVRRKQFEYYNILPEEQNKLQKQSLLFANQAIESMARGKLTLRQAENYMTELGIRQFEAISGRINANAYAMNASTARVLMRHQSDLLDEQRGEIRRRNDSYDLPIMYNGHKTIAGKALQYILVNQNKSALRISLKQPEMLDAQKSLWQSMEYSNYVRPTADVGRSIVDEVQSFTFNSNQETHTTKENWRYDERGNRFVTSGSDTHSSGRSRSSGSGRKTKFKKRK